jgi:hypothetical protein
MMKFCGSILDLYHVCNDPRLTETNDRVIQINDSLQKDYQSAVSLAEHRHLLTVRKDISNNDLINHNVVLVD